MHGHNCVINAGESPLRIYITYPWSSPVEAIFHVVNKLALNGEKDACILVDIVIV